MFLILLWSYDVTLQLFVNNNLWLNTQQISTDLFNTCLYWCTSIYIYIYYIYHWYWNTYTRFCQVASLIYFYYVIQTSLEVCPHVYPLHTILMVALIDPRFWGGSCYSIFSFICMFCRSLFVPLFFFLWPLSCLFFFDLRILITPLVSSNSS